MAILVEEFVDKLNKIESQLIDGLVEIAERAALNAKALVVRRIQIEGVGDYSKEKLPLFFFTEKGGSAQLEKTKSNAGIKFIEKAAKDPEMKKKGINWSDIRDAEGLQTDHVDLTFTGDMFRDLHILGTVVQKARVTTLLGASRPETINKLKWNAQRYGAFMELTAQERRLIHAEMNREYKELIKKVFAK